MAELAVVSPARPSAAAEDVSRRVAAMADRLAARLAREGRDDVPPVGFLREMARSAPQASRHLHGADTPVERLAHRLGLSAFEVDLLVLAGMAEEHEGYAGVFRSLHPQGEPRPSVGLAVQVLCDGPGERAVAADVLEGGGAVRDGVLVLPPGPPFFERSLWPGEDLWPALRGADVWPAPFGVVDAAPCVHGLSGWLASEPVRRCLDALRGDAEATILVVADRASIARHRAAVLVEAAGRRHVAVRPGEGALGAGGLLLAHCALRDVVPVVEVPDRDDGRPATLPELPRLRGAIVLCTGRRAEAPMRDRPVLSVDVPRLSPEERRHVWEGVLPELAHRSELLAARYGLEPDQARSVAADARLLARLSGRDVDESHVADGVRCRSGAPAWSGVQRVHPTASFRDLVLSPRQMGPLREAVSRILHQGKVLGEWGFLRGRRGAAGVRMLLAGPPGTGKTLSAEVMAQALGVDLLVVDVSRVVSKWIGETEKNLARVFDAAEEGQAVLLFDEADALFGRRTEVSDAHDRYANLETAFLLSRIERFDGLTILSTNLRENIDPAFMRRLEFIVGYEEPAATEREALWRCHIPAEAPLDDDLDLAELAALYPIVGGLIRNAAVAAAFLAAAEGVPIGLVHLVHAIRREYEKSGRAFPGAPPALRRRPDTT